jgi:hypothetical protein
MFKSIILALLLSLSIPAFSTESTNQWINLGGLSYHLDQKYNDLNPGLGYERQLPGQYNNLEVIGGLYYNSLKNVAFYAGGRYSYKKDFFMGGDLGATAFLATGYQNNGIPALLPFADICWKYGCLMSNIVVTTINIRIPIK